MAETQEKRRVQFDEPETADSTADATPATNDLTSGITESAHLMKQDLETLNVHELTPLTPEVISRQATINIGTIGHVAHGKSTVVKAISGVHTVRFKNELERNITIRLGYANAKLYGIDMSTVDEKLKTDNMEIKPEFYCARGSAHPDTFAPAKEVMKHYGENAKYKVLRHVSFVDCPGHDILMATMLTGAAIMDAALLLIAANETCPQPQTNEHLAAIEIMKLRHIIVLQNKIDLITQDEAKQQHEAITNFIKGTVAEKAPIIPVSAQLKFNIDVLCQFMIKNIPLPVRDFTSTPRLIVIRSFDINKPGCQVEDLQGGIAGGSILHGVFRVGDEIEIRPGKCHRDSVSQAWHARPLRSKIVTISTEKNSLQYAVPGGLIGMGLTVDPMICRGDRLVGNVIGLPDTLPDIYDMVEVSFHLMRHLAGMRQEDGQRKTQKVKSLEKGETLQVNIGSCCTTATVKNVNKDQCRLELASPIAAEKNEKVAISRRIERHWRLIGWGEIVRGHSVVIEQ